MREIGMGISSGYCSDCLRSLRDGVFVDMFDPLVSRLLCGMLLVLNSSMPFALIMLVTALVVHTIVPINQD